MVGPIICTWSHPVNKPVANTTVLAVCKTSNVVIVLAGDIDTYLVRSPPMNVPIHNDVMMLPAENLIQPNILPYCITQSHENT